MNKNRILFYRKSGHGRPVVILHGLFGMSDNWQGFVKVLAERDFSVYAVDLRNHGQSFHDDEFSLEIMAEDVTGLFSSEGIDQPVIIGHSLGGKVAMQLALTHPETLSGLIVVDIAPRYYPVHHQLIIDTIRAVNLTGINSRKDVEAMLDKPGIDPATKQFLMKNLYRKTDQSLDWRFNLEPIANNIDEVGKEITSAVPFLKPVLFVRGENSSYINLNDQEMILKLFPRAEIKTAPAAGHWVHADNPSWLVEEIIRFAGKEG